LRISENQIGRSGAEALAGSQYLTGLQILEIANNQIDNEGAKALAESKHLHGMRMLDIHNNKISDPQVIIHLCDKLLNHWPAYASESEGKPQIEVMGNPLQWKGVDGRVSDTILWIRDPRELKKRLEEIRDAKDRARICMARIVMAGPTKHGKSHLAGWLTAQTEEQKNRLRQKQERGINGDGTWGGIRIKAEFPLSEHGQIGLPGIQISVIDCGGHPQQLLSHQNLYYPSWGRSVFVLCVRADCDFVESWGEYHLGLIADLKTNSVAWNRGTRLNARELEQEQRVASPDGDPERTMLPVVLVATHADQAKVNGRKLEFPCPEAMSSQHRLLDALETKAWDALTGSDIAEIKRTVGKQLAKLPELRAGLPKYVAEVGEEVEKLFRTDSDEAGAPEVNSISFSEFKVICNRLGVDDIDHLYTLRELNSLGYVVAPRCHEPKIGSQQTVLNPRFVQYFLYRTILGHQPRPSDGIINTETYRILTCNLTDADRSTLESLMASCLVAFRITGRGDQPLGWLIPDLLEATDTWPRWSDLLWSVHLEVAGFLNESVFFEFVRGEKDLIEEAFENHKVRLQLYRNFCVVRNRSTSNCQALVRFDVRKKTIDIEVRGRDDDGAWN
jgi:hypothetical protein